MVYLHLYPNASFRLFHALASMYTCCAASTEDVAARVQFAERALSASRLALGRFRAELCALVDTSSFAFSAASVVDYESRARFTPRIISAFID